MYRHDPVYGRDRDCGHARDRDYGHVRDHDGALQYQEYKHKLCLPITQKKQR